MKLSLSRLLIIAITTAVCAANTQAQVLSNPNPVGRVSDVAQFGVPRDSKYIFCEDENCPERSVKHIQSPIVPIVGPELSHAKVQKPKPKHKKKPIKKIANKQPKECPPCQSQPIPEKP